MYASLHEEQCCKKSSLKFCKIRLILTTLPSAALLLPSAEMKAKRSGAFISADGSKTVFNFNPIGWIMINNFLIGKMEFLRQKQRDVQIARRLQAGLNCFRFEAKTILNCVYNVCHPFFDNTDSMKFGQILFEVVSVENPAKGKFSCCPMKSVILTWEYIAIEAFRQAGLLIAEEIVCRLLNCGVRNFIGKIKVLKDNRFCLPLRSTIKDMGSAISHLEMKSFANCVEKFKRVICLAKDNHEISTIAFQVQKSRNRFNNFKTR